MTIFLLVLHLQAPAAPSVAPGRGAPVVSIPRIEADVRIDGVLDEPPWAQATRLTEFSQYQPVDGRPAEEQTDVLVWYSPDALWFGIIARDHDPASIRATVAERDKLDRDDTVTIYLDTFNDRRRAFFFEVNPLGVQQDGVQSEGQYTAGNLFGGSTDKSPDYLFQSKGLLTEEGYCVEVRIPFRSLRYPGNAPQRWGINVKRKTQRNGYEDTWTDVRRASASFLAQSGTIEGLHDLERGLVTEAQPFSTVVFDGHREAGTGAFAREPVDVNPGVNVRFGLTNVSFDATVKPDFSQVESDAGLVTVNERFALFYPEKRPFFLEGIELFSTPNQLVYTRQIASPIAGGKFTGKMGSYGIGYLIARDDVPGGGDATFDIMRVRRDIGKDSLAGITFTDRTSAGGYNRVLAGDLRIVFAKLYFVQGQLGGSWTREAGPARSSPLWELQFDRTGRNWGFNYRLTGVGESFVSRSGFVPRSDVVNGFAVNRGTWYGERGARVENVTGYASITRIWRYDGFVSDDAIEGEESLDLSVRLRGGWTVAGTLRNDFFTFERADYAGYTVDKGPGTIEPYDPPPRMKGALTYSAGLTSPAFRSFNAQFTATKREIPIFPEASEGSEALLQASLGLRPGESIRVDSSMTLSQINRRRGGIEFARTLIPRCKIEYQPRRSLFFRVVGELRIERQAALREARTGDPLLVDGVASQPSSGRSLRLDWLFSYQPTPGTSVFAGYGTSLEDVPLDGAFRRTRDGFFVKLAYVYRR